MTEFGSHVREQDKVEKALEEAYAQIKRFSLIKIKNENEIPEAFKNRHLVLAHTAYLEAIRFYLKNDGGSRGSYLVMSKEGVSVLAGILDQWTYKSENPSLREKIIETILKNGHFECNLGDRRPLPQQDDWFENVWNDFLTGKVYKDIN
jgi:hypothetical protein